MQKSTSSAGSESTPVEVPVADSAASASSDEQKALAPKRTPKVRPKSLFSPVGSASGAATAPAARQYGTFPDKSAAAPHTEVDEATQKHEQAPAAKLDKVTAEDPNLNLWAYLTSPSSPIVRVRDHCHQQWIAVVFSLLLLGVILYMILDVRVPMPTSSCNSEFGLFLGEFNGVTAYSNCKYEYSADGLDHFVTVGLQRVYSGAKWHALEYARRYWIMTRYLTFPTLADSDVFFNLSTAVMVTSSSRTPPLRRRLSSPSSTATVAAHSTFYSTIHHKGEAVPLQRILNLAAPVLKPFEERTPRDHAQDAQAAPDAKAKSFLKALPEYPRLPPNASGGVDGRPRGPIPLPSEVPYGGPARDGKATRPAISLAVEENRTAAKLARTAQFASNPNGIPMRDFILDRRIAFPQEGDVVVYRPHRRTLPRGHVAVVVGSEGPFRSLDDVGQRVLAWPTNGNSSVRERSHRSDTYGAPYSPNVLITNSVEDVQDLYTDKATRGQSGGKSDSPANADKSRRRERSKPREPKKDGNANTDDAAVEDSTTDRLRATFSVEHEEGCLYYVVYVAEQNWNNRPWIDTVTIGKKAKTTEQLRRTFSRTLLLKEYYPSRTYYLEDGSGQSIVGWIRSPA